MLNQGAVTVEVSIQLKNDLSNRERIRAINNHPSTHITIIRSVMKVMVVNQIHASNADLRITSSIIALRIRKFTGTRKILKIVLTD